MKCSSTQPCSETLENFPNGSQPLRLWQCPRVCVPTAWRPLSNPWGKTWKSSSPRTPHPCTKKHFKKLKTTHSPPKKKLSLHFQRQKTFGKKKETFPRCAFLQTWWVDPNRSLVMKGIFLITPPRTTQRQFYGRPVPPPPQRYHRQSSWHSPFAGVLPGRETPSVLAKMSGETQ